MQNTNTESNLKAGQSEEEREAYIQAMTKAAEPTFWGYLGCQMESAGEEEIVVTLDAQPHHLNMMGIVHGGVLSSLMDNAMGIAVMLKRPGESTVTSNLNVHFVMPAKEGKLTVRAHIVHETRRSVTTESRITDGNGELVAISTGSFRVK
ncbi:PaaI family thioesterase [Paenibacillus sp. DMB20]|uniref:PaaI family thioesterase n=1 Tax=Paenibacillus sp. DMB20 TaxID=1642570 RepID=UPI000627BF39|nr:PaaI family thioesterase [Paenibacillus sp. DMB20]KKO52675.1 thioesterase [Paenibacillus sp. DMB20]